MLTGDLVASFRTYLSQNALFEMSKVKTRHSATFPVVSTRNALGRAGQPRTGSQAASCQTAVWQRKRMRQL